MQRMHAPVRLQGYTSGVTRSPAARAYYDHGCRVRDTHSIYTRRVSEGQSRRRVVGFEVDPVDPLAVVPQQVVNIKA